MYRALVLMVVWSGSVRAFPDGAPIDACVKTRVNQPNHGQHRARPGPPPYAVSATAARYRPGDAVTVTIEGAELFKGFFMQARSVETNDWIGGWEQAANTTVHPECASITHADPQDKVRATLVWRAPNAHGRVYFTGTVLKTYSTFWADVVAQPPPDPRDLQILGAL